MQSSNLELEGKRAQIQAILDGISDVIAVLSLDRRILSVNKIYYDVYPESASLWGNTATRFSGGIKSPVLPARF